MGLILMLVGVYVFLFLLRAYYRRHWADEVESSIAFDRPFVTAGTSLNLVEVVTNRKRMPIPYLDLKFEMNKNLKLEETVGVSRTDKSYRDDIFSLLSFQRVTRKIPVVAGKRGLYFINGAQLVSSGIFMEDIMIKPVEVATQLTVYPKLVDVNQFEIPYAHLNGILEKASFTDADPFAFRGIREYRPTDSMHAVNWKASARSETFMVNTFNTTVSPDVCILLDFDPVGNLTFQALQEESISIAASFANELIAEGVSVSLISNGRDSVTDEEARIFSSSSMGHKNTIGTTLAMLDTEREVRPMAEVMEETVKFLQEKDATVFVLISSSQRKETYEGLDALMKIANTPALVVVPLHADMPLDTPVTRAQVDRWEVSR